MGDSSKQSKRERQTRRALALSQRNQRAGAPRRKARRLAARLGIVLDGSPEQIAMVRQQNEFSKSALEKKSVGELREICAAKGIKTTTKIRTKIRKAGLIEMIVGR